jgi:hypothetical protein
LKKYKTDLLYIFKLEGKQQIYDELEKNTTLLGKIIFNENYYITNIDVWVIINYFSIPFVLISSTKLSENNNELFVMNSPSGPVSGPASGPVSGLAPGLAPSGLAPGPAPLTSDTSSGFYFVNVQANLVVDTAPIYKLLFTESKEYNIPLTQLTVPTQKKIQAGKKENILETYLIKLKTLLQPAEVSSKLPPKKMGKLKL